MGKTIRFNENGLIAIKKKLNEITAGIDGVSHNDVCENVDDEFAPVAEIGMEEGGGPGLYAHEKEVDEEINESYNTATKADISRVDYIDYVPHDNPREEGYDATNITEFEPHYDLECYDVQGELVFRDDLTLNELFDYFPDRIIHMMSNKEGRRVSQSQLRIEDILSWNTKPNNIDDVEEVNAIAKRIQPGGPSSYLLTDGEIISFPDHMQITSIDGMTPSKFVGLGNIRVGVGGIEISKMPTSEQIKGIKNLVRQGIETYGDHGFYIDIVKDEGKFYPEGICCAVYKPANPTRIINDIIYYFQDGVRPQSTMTYESKKRWSKIVENLEPEVASSEVDLSSFKKRDTLPPGIWKDEETLDSRVRLKLLDIADDFWEFINLSWVEPKGIIITGSICNFNWSKFSDIDLHIIADFREIDEKTEFVKQYVDSKKNEWNNEHEGLKIMGFPVELYVQDVDDDIEAGGIYDLEENAWVRRPNPHSIKSIGLNKFSIKDKAAEIMTIIDDMYDKLSTTTDGHEIDQIGDDAHYLWDKVKDLRKKSLKKNGENGSGNIVYKVLRRTGYLDKLFKLFSTVYDRSNSITESMKKYLTVLKEEVALDGSTEDNPYEKRWKAEREALKSFVANYGKLMQSKEDNKGGKLYKVYFDETMSNLIGYNYCICVQWNEQEMKPGSTVYIRALDKFTPFIRRDLQFDTRGRDNMRGTYDDTGY